MDRKLDMEIAEKVMGWKPTSLHDPSMSDYVATGVYDTGSNTRILPEFSSDMNAAWEAVEHMLQGDQGAGPTGEEYYPDEDPITLWRKYSYAAGSSNWYCEFYSACGERFEAEGKTAPEAICKAALAAVSRRVDDKA